MPFDSPHWTLAEAIIWIMTRDEKKVDALSMLERNSISRLFYPGKDRVAVLEPKQVRQGRAELFNVLGAAKLGATGIVMADRARQPIPADAWPNIVVNESQHFDPNFRLKGSLIVLEASINVRLKAARRTLREWRDVRVNRDDMLKHWPGDKRGAVERQFSKREPPPEFMKWAEEQRAAGKMIKQGDAKAAMTKKFGKPPTGPSGNAVEAWCQQFELNNPGSTARRGDRWPRVKSANRQN
jgi:hypothetical protein